MKKPPSKVTHNRPQIFFQSCAELSIWPKSENPYYKYVYVDTSVYWSVAQTCPKFRLYFYMYKKTTAGTFLKAFVHSLLSKSNPKQVSTFLEFLPKAKRKLYVFYLALVYCCGRQIKVKSCFIGDKLFGLSDAALLL